MPSNADLPILCVANQLYINNGDSTFTDMAAAFGVDDSTGCALGVTLTDYDHDGDLDILVANLGGGVENFGNVKYVDLTYALAQGWVLSQSPRKRATLLLPEPARHRLFRNDLNEVPLPDPPFTDVAAPFGMDAGSWAMGAAAGDYDNDADLDYYITDYFNAFLFTNTGVTFTEDADETGTTENSGVSWGAAFFDPDNDGLADLYVAHGDANAGATPDGTIPDRLYMNNGDGTFVDQASLAGVGAATRGRSVAVADYDGDGKEDLFVTSVNGFPSRLFRNTTANANNSLSIRLAGVGNERGIGAKVRVTSGQGTSSRTQLKEVHAGSGHGSGNDLTRLHFGLGSDAFATLVTVEWLSGCVQVLNRVYPEPGGVEIAENCQ